MGSKCVWTSSVLLMAKRGPLKTSVSRKTIRSDDISHVNLMVGWKLFAKVTKSLISCSLIVHTEKMSSIKRFQRIGLKGLAASSCLSM